MERAPVYTADHIKAIGANNLESYRDQANLSNVPVYFFYTSRFLIASVDPKVSRNDLAVILFGFGFKTDEQAWAAIKYAEAMSIIKDAYSSKSPDWDEDEIDHTVGLSTIFKANIGDTFQKAVDKVEKHFNNPRNALNFFYFSQQLEAKYS